MYLVVSHQEDIFWYPDSKQRYVFQLPSSLHPHSFLLELFQLLSHVWLFVTPWTEECQNCLSFTVSQSLLKLMSIESMIPANHLILCRPLLLLPSIFSSISVQLLVTTGTVACQAPLSMEFSRQEYWGGLPFPPPRDLPNTGMEPKSLTSSALAVDSLPLSHLGSPYTYIHTYIHICMHKFKDTFDHLYRKQVSKEKQSETQSPLATEVVK